MLNISRVVPGKQFGGAGPELVPAVAADYVADADCWIFQLHVSNVNGAARTLTIKNGSAVVVFNKSIAGTTTEVFSWPFGVKCAGDLNWVASAADSLYVEIFGVKKDL